MINNSLIIANGGKSIPPKPSGFSLSTTSVGPYNIDIAWTAPTFYAAFARYEVYRDGGLIATITNQGTLSYSDSVSPETYYEHYVRAVDVNGLSSYSNTVGDTTGTPPEANPPTVSWDLSQDANYVYWTVYASDYESGLYGGWISAGNWNNLSISLYPSPMWNYGGGNSATYNFKAPKAGKPTGTYYYHVYVYDNIGNTFESGRQFFTLT